MIFCLSLSFQDVLGTPLILGSAVRLEGALKVKGQQRGGPSSLDKGPPAAAAAVTQACFLLQVAGIRAQSLPRGAVCAGEGRLPSLGCLVQQPPQ